MKTVIFDQFEGWNCNMTHVETVQAPVVQPDAVPQVQAAPAAAAAAAAEADTESPGTPVNSDDEDDSQRITMEDLENNSNLDPARAIADIGAPKRRRLTCNEYYKYIFAVRTVLTILHLSGKLGQKYAVDAWLKCEANTLQWIAQNQPKLRADTYSGLQEYIANRAEHGNARPGIPVVLPSSFPVG